MPLSTSHASGDTILASDIDAIATQVNSNTDALTTKLEVDGSNFTDGGAALAAAMGVAGAVVVASSGVTTRLWVQTADPGSAAADGDVWISAA
jgi:hypothetical protein